MPGFAKLQKANQEHLYQELQHLRISLKQDIQFQLNLLAKAVEQNRISHLESQEACRPRGNACHTNVTRGRANNTGSGAHDKTNFGTLLGIMNNKR